MPSYLTSATTKVKIKLPSHLFLNSHGCVNDVRIHGKSAPFHLFSGPKVLWSKFDKKFFALNFFLNALILIDFVARFLLSGLEIMWIISLTPKMIKKVLTAHVCREMTRPNGILRMVAITLSLLIYILANLFNKCYSIQQKSMLKTWVFGFIVDLLRKSSVF